jgi:hypothetical protein
VADPHSAARPLSATHPFATGSTAAHVRAAIRCSAALAIPAAGDWRLRLSLRAGTVCSTQPHTCWHSRNAYLRPD